LIFSVAVGIPLGIVSAVRKDKTVDHASRLYALSGISMPIFWLGLLLQFVFYYQFRINGLPGLPSSGRVDAILIDDYPLRRVTGMYLIDSLITGNFRIFFDALVHMIMPAFCLSYHSMAIITRMMRSSMLEVMRQDYITLARAKGLSERTVIYKHALRNAMIPTMTVIGLTFGGLLGGAVLTETVFSWPGMGRWSARAILSNDYAAVMGFMLLTSLIYVMANLVVDVIYSVLDPRIRYG